MNTDQVRAVRRANPIMMLAAGVLVGALLVAIRQPGKGTSVLASGSGGTRPRAAAGGSIEQASGGGGVADAGGGGATGGGGGGGGATGGGGGATGDSGGAVAASGACSGAPSSGVEGVTDTSIKVGFGVPDLSALKALGPGIDPGDIPAHVNAILAGMRKDGLLPVCGRDISPVFRTYNVLDPSQSRSVCVGFADEDHVFAVIPNFGFSAPDCVTVEKHRFLLDSGDSEFVSNYQSSNLLFGLNPPQDVEMRNVAHWLMENHLLDGKKVGVYYNESGPGGATPPGAAVRTNFLDVLAALGHPVDVIVTTNYNQLTGDPNDSIAVQRFRTEGVQVGIPLAGQTNFFTIAKSQNYHAQWVQWGVAMASDAVTSNYPADTFDGALALLWDHVGEASVNIPPNPMANKCMGYWNAAGGTTPSRTAAEDQTIRETCDQLDLFVKALGSAGPNLTEDSMVAGMEQASGADMSYYAEQVFDPTKHWGSTQVVQQQWAGGCTCWKEQPPFRPFYSS